MIGNPINKTISFFFSAILLLLIVGVSARAGERDYGPWRSSALGGGGYLQQVVFCPSNADRLYLTSDVGGLYRSDDRGQTWRMLHGGLPAGGGAYEVRGLVVDPDNADRLVIACGSRWSSNGGVFVSDDGGASWRNTLKQAFSGNSDTRMHGRILVASPADAKVLLAASDHDGVWRSTDAGETWRQADGPTNTANPSDMVFDRSDPDRVWLSIAMREQGKTRGLFGSKNAGQSFELIGDQAPSELLQDPSNSEVLIGIIGQRPVRSVDRGAAWQTYDAGLPAKSQDARTDGGYGALAAGPDFIILGGNGGSFYRLNQADDTWEKIARGKVDEGNWWGRLRAGVVNHFGSALGYIAIDPHDPAHWYFTDWYACYETSNSGHDWRLRVDGIEMLVVHTVVFDPHRPGVLHVGAADLGYLRSSDNGKTLQWLPNGISNNIKCISPSASRPGLLYAVGPTEWQWFANQVFITTDDGLSWSRSPMTGLPDMAQARCNTIASHPANPDEVFLAVSGPIGSGHGGVYRSADTGKTWQWMGQGLPDNGPYFRSDIWVHGPELAVSPDGSMVAISCDRGLIHRYDQPAATWRAVSRPSPGGGPNSIVADPTVPGRFYLAMKEGGLFRSNDRGVTWQSISSANVHAVAVDPHESAHLAAVTPTDTLVSADGGEHWAALGRELPYRHSRNVVALSEQTVAVGTGGSGVFTTRFNAESSPADTLSQVIAPDDARLVTVGRFVVAKDGAKTASWSGSLLRFTADTTTASALLGATGINNRVQIIVDGRATEVIRLRDGTHQYVIAAGLTPGAHTFEIIKATEPLFGEVTFSGLRLPTDARLLPTPARSRQIELIGDSVSVGFGIEAASEKEKFSPLTQNVWLAYGSIVARALNADLHVIGWSGKTLWPKNSLLELYDRTIPTRQSGDWDPKPAGWSPQVVLINLGANDFAGGNPEEEGWVSAYRAFIGRLRTRYPQARFYCLISPTITDEYSRSKNALTTIRRYVQRVIDEEKQGGHDDVGMIAFVTQKSSDGFGAQWHPSRRTNEKMAALVIQTLGKDMGWTAPTSQKD